MARVTKIQMRRDTEAAFIAAQTTAGSTPILDEGEIGFILSGTNAGKFKIGDGVSLWGALTYATDGSKLTGTINASTATTLATARNINGVSFNGSADITVPAAAGTLTGGTLASGVTGSSLTSVGAIGTGTWQGSIVQPTYGGTGNIYGAALVGRATLAADRTRAGVLSGTPEEAFWNAGGTAVQYFNLEADTLYSFDGFVQITKDSTSALPRASAIYYSTGTTALTPQAFTCEILAQTNTALIGLIDLTAVNTATNSGGTASAITTFNYRFSGFIRTNATTAGRFNLAFGLSATPSTTNPIFKSGSTISLYKHGTGNAVNFGNWTA
jgi:hypothetical protein